MPHDPRHLRARWTIASTGWLLWLISLCLPVPSMPTRRLRIWDSYLELLHDIHSRNWRPYSTDKLLVGAVMLGALVATIVLLLSPLLVRLNHSYSARIRRWRWLGIGLLAMAQVTVAHLYFRSGLDCWPFHFLVLPHLVLCIAIIPWPREQLATSSAFEVILPPTATDPNRAHSITSDPRNP